MREKFKLIDYWLLVPVLLLVPLGAIMVYSASSSMLANVGLTPTYYLKKQLIFAIIGLFGATFAFALRADVLYRKRFVLFWLALTFILMAILVILRIVRPSAAINGAVGWISIGGFTIQPVEMAKLALILYFAFIFGRRQHVLYAGHYFKSLTPPLVVAVILMGMAALQPDIGGASILLLISLVMIAVSGIPWIYSLGIIGGLTAVFTVGVRYLGNASANAPILKLFKLEYQLDRFRAFAHPFQLEQHGGAQLVNSYYAISNGGWFGKGLGNSIQKSGYLPEPYTDFILSIVAEELGVIGVTVILILLGIIILRSFLIGLRVRQTSLALICFGIGTMFFVQVFFNVGGLLGLLPITGVTLPFISSGGSNLIISLISIGILMNISAFAKKQAALKEVRS
ncbi:FtsW/RodA/SpoVE family cell cycle protein [Lapidilactobacillus achengensis]|uniref:Probable peptidoglycan glycosyltransferase FtsW n=1 Tax=Lapidilactobacillus achengensis TaxID=2486000 RepID=A0ABW1UTI9_9LACO|nr:FtsW/RodA/SpoVE family cell cycle protein [Lapidilactobacillus achengensis]